MRSSQRASAAKTIGSSSQTSPTAPPLLTCDRWRTSSEKGPAALITVRAYTLCSLPDRLSRTTAPTTLTPPSCR